MVMRPLWEWKTIGSSPVTLMFFACTLIRFFVGCIV